MEKWKGGGGIRDWDKEFKMINVVVFGKYKKILVNYILTHFLINENFLSVHGKQVYINNISPKGVGVGVMELQGGGAIKLYFISLWLLCIDISNSLLYYFVYVDIITLFSHWGENTETINQDTQ